MQKALAQLSLGSPDATARLARKVAPLLSPGDAIMLQGPVGAGKSHFARALILARLEVASRVEDVPSPTFTLVQTYDDDIGEIWHADLYRLSDPAEVDELGLIDAFETAICLVEWPDRLGELLPDSALTLKLEEGDTEDSRVATFLGDPDRWSKLAPAFST